jgi:hypothetical protein
VRELSVKNTGGTELAKSVIAGQIPNKRLIKTLSVKIAIDGADPIYLSHQIFTGD